MLIHLNAWRRKRLKSWTLAGNDDNEEHCLLGYNIVQSVESQLTFRMKMWPPFSVSKYNPSKYQGGKQPPAFTLVSCSSYSSTLKMEAIFSSEISVNFQRTTRCYILLFITTGMRASNSIMMIILTSILFQLFSLKSIVECQIKMANFA
jgi:hypothetical protein